MNLRAAAFTAYRRLSEKREYVIRYSLHSIFIIVYRRASCQVIYSWNMSIMKSAVRGE